MRFFFTYVDVRVLNTRQWTSLRVLSTPYVYVGKKNASLENSLKEVNYLERRLFARYIPRDVSGEEPPFSVINSYEIPCRNQSLNMERAHK